MADVNLLKGSVPVITTDMGLFVETGAVATGDDLNLGSQPMPASRDLILAPAVAVAVLNSISDGVYPGQRVRLHVSNANTLQIPAALGNVDLAADLDVLKEDPAALLWSGSAWIKS